MNNEEAKQLFSELAEEESRYNKKLEKIFAHIEKYTAPETYIGEYAQYLGNYIDSLLPSHKRP